MNTRDQVRIEKLRAAVEQERLNFKQSATRYTAKVFRYKIAMLEKKILVIQTKYIRKTSDSFLYLQELKRREENLRQSDLEIINLLVITLNVQDFSEEAKLNKQVADIRLTREYTRNANLKKSLKYWIEKGASKC